MDLNHIFIPGDIDERLSDCLSMDELCIQPEGKFKACCVQALLGHESCNGHADCLHIMGSEQTFMGNDDDVFLL